MHNGTKMNERTIKQKEFFASIAPEAAVFFASACVMILELAAGRLVARHFGSSLYTWTGVIGVTLAGLTMGNYLGGRIADYSARKKTIAVLFGIASVTCIGSIALNYSLEKWTMFPGLSWSLYSLAYISIVFVSSPVFLGAIIPVAAKTSLELRQKTGNTIGKIYAFGAAGSIAGTFAAGFWLISGIGPTGVFWAISAALLMAGFLYSPGYRPLYLWGVVLAALFILGTTKNQNLAQTGVMLSLRNKPDPNIIYEEETKYCHIHIYKKSDNPDKRIFFQDRLAHSIVVMGDVTNMQYEYERIFAAVTEQAIKKRENPAFLTIGGGGFIFPRYLKYRWPAGKADVVEIDPGVIRAATAAFGLEKNNGLNIFIMDGRNFVDDMVAKKQAGKDVPQYDLIYEDAYDNFSLPYQLATREFNENIHGILKEDGFYMLNLIDIYNSGLVAGSVLNTLKQTFKNVYVVASAFEYYGRITFVLIASNKTLDTDSLIAEISKYFPDIWLLTEAETETLKAKSKNIILTDDYSPMDNLAAPVSIQDKASTSANNYIAKAQRMSANNEWEQAIEQYKKVIEICEPLTVSNYVDICEDMLRHREFQDSFLICQKAIEYYDRPEIKTDISTIQLSMSASLRGLGRLYEARKYLDRAIEGLKRRLRVTPEAPDVLSNLGMALASTGELAEARIYLERAVNAAPSSPEYRFMLITVLIDQKDYVRVQAAIKDAINAMKQSGNAEAVSQLQQLSEQVTYQQSQIKQ